MTARPLVLDTNIVLDLFVFADPQAEPLRQQLASGALDWIATAAMRAELERVLSYPQIVPRLAYYQRSAEQVLARDPDYIVTVAMYFGEGPSPVDEIKGRAGWENLKAIRNDSVFNANSDEFARPGPRLLDAARSLSDFVYGGEET